MKSTSKVTRKHQGPIPKKARQKTRAETGDKTAAADKGELIVLQKRNKAKTLLEFAGCWQGHPKDTEEIMSDIRNVWSTGKSLPTASAQSATRR